MNQSSPVTPHSTTRRAPRWALWSPLLLAVALLAPLGRPEPSPSTPAAPQRPFPQHVTYAAGSLRPSNFTQVEQDDHVRAFYAHWRDSYLVSAGDDGQGNPLYRVAFGVGSPATVSEGQGFGMIVTAIMAGHDPDAQAYFDGLWRFSRAYPSGGDPRLMTWKVENGVPVGGNSSAFDGDADIAYGLLLADAQWGSDGAIDYAAEALTVIAAIDESTVGPQSRLPMLGDWVNPNGGPHNQYTPRSSDVMPAHFRAYSRATGDPGWETVAANALTAAANVQAGYAANTGLLPDFIINCNPLAACAPAYAGFLEGSHDGHYYYNAGRDPWRIGLDALLNDNAASRALIAPLIDWINTTSGGAAANIKAGYTLDGAPIGNYFTTFFVAPLGVAAMATGTHQALLDDIYASVYDRHENYYEDSVTLLTLLVMSGNYWDPTVAVGPVIRLGTPIAVPATPITP